MTPNLIGAAHAVETQRWYLFGKLAHAEAAIDRGIDLTDGVLGAILNDTTSSSPPPETRPAQVVPGASSFCGDAT